jgi:hypothetical protein
VTGRAVRATALGLLTLDAAALLACLLVAGTGPEPASATSGDRGTVVESRCLDGRITESIDDGNPVGLLAYDTGVTC